MSKTAREMMEELRDDCKKDNDVFALDHTDVKYDKVNNPSHYIMGGIETIDYMKAKSTPEEFTGHLRLTAIKYLSRAGYKDDMLQDYKKAQWYINKLIAEIEGSSCK